MKKQSKEEVIKEIRGFFQKAKSNPEESEDYIRKARRFGMKNQIPLPSDLKRKFCKHCHVYFIPGKNYRVRTNQGKVIYFCLNCKKFTRYPFLKERKFKRNPSSPN